MFPDEVCFSLVEYKMNVALLNWGIGLIKGEVFGGIENVMMEIKKGLTDHGDEVILFGNAPGGNTQFRHIDYDSRIPHLGLLMYIEKFLLKTRNSDIRHFHNCPTGVIFSPRRSIAYFHNEVHLNYHKIFWKRYNKGTFVFVSEYLKNKTLSAFPRIEPRRCFVIHNAVDVDIFSPSTGSGSHDTPRIIFVGQWNRKKGLPILLHAVALLQQKGLCFELALVGGLDLWPGEEGESAISQTKLNEMLDGLSNVRLAGKLRRDELVNELQQSSIGVAPSLWQEPFGLIAIEAMACGLPVVATRAGGLPEIVEDNECGLLVEPGSAEDLARALEKLISDPAMTERMGRAARERAVKYFSKEIWIQKIIALHNEIMADA